MKIYRQMDNERQVLRKANMNLWFRWTYGRIYRNWSSIGTRQLGNTWKKKSNTKCLCNIQEDMCKQSKLSQCTERTSKISLNGHSQHFQIVFTFLIIDDFIKVTQMINRNILIYGFVKVFQMINRHSRVNSQIKN